MTDQNTDPSRRDALRVTAGLLSDFFSPLLMPSYAMLVALWLTLMNRLPPGVRWWSTAGVFFITGIIPLLTIFTLIRIGKVSDTAISNRRERTVPFLVSVACYIGAGFYLRALHAPFWMQCFLIGAAVTALSELFISMKWKISAHTAAAGGLAAFVFWLAKRGALIVEPFVAVSVAFLLVGLLAWARLYLKRHTPLQVLAGAALGFGIMLGLECMIV